MVELIWSERAKNDLKDIYDFIKRDNPKASKKIINRIYDNAQKLSILPRIGAILHEYDDPNLRRIIVGHYAIVYRIVQEKIYIITIHHTSQILDL